MDPNAWPTSPSQVPATLEQLTGHDLMAMFPTQAPKQPVCCDDIFRSQVRDFLARQTLPVVIIQESPEVVFGAASDESSRARAVEDVNLNARSFVPRQRRTSKVRQNSVIAVLWRGSGVDTNYHSNHNQQNESE